MYVSPSIILLLQHFHPPSISCVFLHTIVVWAWTHYVVLAWMFFMIAYVFHDCLVCQPLLHLCMSMYNLYEFEFGFTLCWGLSSKIGWWSIPSNYYQCCSFIQWSMIWWPTIKHSYVLTTRFWMSNIFVIWIMFIDITSGVVNTSVGDLCCLLFLCALIIPLIWIFSTMCWNSP